jgi:excisionase family DNA binding protein
MSLEDDLRDLIRDVTRLTLREVLPELLREYLKPHVDAPRRERIDGTPLSSKAAADYAGVSPETIREWVSKGLLRAQRAGRVIKIRQSDLDAYLARAGSHDDGVIDLSERAREILSGKKRSRE